MAKKTGQNPSLFDLFAQFVLGNDVLKINFAIFSTRRLRLRLGSVAAALLDSPQQSVDST